MLEVSQLFIYPIKSLGGIACQSAEPTATGFKKDRRWMLADEQNVLHQTDGRIKVGDEITVAAYNAAFL